LAEIDKSLQDSESECESALSIINELANTIRSYRSRIEIDPNEVEEKRERLGSLNLLKKKYGGSLLKVIEYREKIGNEFQLAENFSDEILKLEKEIEEIRRTAGESAEKLSNRRKKISSKVEGEVRKTLSQLGISDSVFDIKITNILPDNKSNNFVYINKKKLLADEKGVDGVEFYISTNPGEDPKPLAKVASGGEVSRIMLSLKSILAQSDKLPLLIFDEIDTGVSGRIAQKVGATLKNLASFHQIISITHLPQIAGLAAHHFSVEKKQIDNRAISLIKKLSEDERINEIAKLMSGEELSKASIESAKQLITNKN
ncbi:MAG: DNA repair protein RecN, partial [Ignavibacteriaceae bacterium]|nr:DNA repair protein RecN [Ignavibacteriaceae bacterium]